MQQIKTKQFKTKQRGAALLILLTIIVLGAAYLLITKLNGISGKLNQNQQTIDALAQAKDALIGFALTYSESFPGQPQGYLPCPDLDGDGSADPPCVIRGQTYIGRLPWAQLGLPILRDGTGECLWYVLSGTYKNNPKESLTSDTDGQLIIEDAAGNITIGNTPTTRAIALIIGPGSTIDPQDRSIDDNTTATECGSTTLADPLNQAANYLDSLGDINNADGTDAGAGGGMPGSLTIPIASPNQALASVFVKSPYVKDGNGNVIFNDTVMEITPADFSNVYVRMNQWVGNRVVSCLEDYQAVPVNSGKFPWASDFDPGIPPNYTGNSLIKYGRIPDAGSFVLDGDSMDNFWATDSSGGGGLVTCFEEINKPQDWFWWWWDAWKEIVFIGVDVNYAPNGSTISPAALKLDTVDQPAIVLVSGRRLVGQSRVNNAEKANITNYLEAENNNGDDIFIRGPSTNTFNDVVLPVTSGP